MLQHASISSSSLYQDCAKKFEFKYIYKFPAKQSLPMVLGSTNHRMLEHINKALRDNKGIPSAVELDALLTAELASIPDTLFSTQRRASKADERLSDDEFVARQRADVKRQLFQLSALYTDKLKTELGKVILVEQEHTFSLEGIPFKMIVDAVIETPDEKLKVLEFKTRSKRSEEVAILQLAAYSVGIKDLTGRDIAALEQWNFIKKAAPEIQVISLNMDEIEELVATLRTETVTFWKGVEQKFFPRNLHSMYCGPEKCEFWDLCMKPTKFKAAIQELNKTIPGFSAQRS